MALKYQKPLIWGRSFDEYRRMFRLSDADLDQSILGCADGPASFNARMRRLARRVISCDPLYSSSAGDIRQRIDESYEDVMAQLRRNEDRFVWTTIASPDELGRVRLDAMMEFLDDYERGRQEGRYVVGQLPNLPFQTRSFDLVLCSHFLFLYSDSLSLPFHLQSVAELCRIAREVRFFPLLTYNGEACPFVHPIVERLEEAGSTVSFENVPYEFQRGGNVMLKIVVGKRS